MVRGQWVAAYGGEGFKGTAAVSGERPVGAASCGQQDNEVSCQAPPGPPGVTKQQPVTELFYY